MNAMQMILMEEWSVVVARVAVSNSREKERGCLARGKGNPPGYAPMSSRGGLLVLRSSEPGFVYRKLSEIAGDGLKIINNFKIWRKQI